MEAAKRYSLKRVHDKEVIAILFSSVHHQQTQQTKMLKRNSFSDLRSKYLMLYRAEQCFENRSCTYINMHI